MARTIDRDQSQSAPRRTAMVARQIEARGVRDPRVLAALRAVPREDYVRPSLEEFAYDDTPLPIAEGQTISQPYIVAFMTEAARIGASDRVLEIGTGSGYAAAVLAEIAAEVHTIERHEGLARTAAERRARAGYENVTVHTADGTRGWPDAAPYDAIIVSAGAPRVPPSLREQLAIGGRLVIPVGAGREDQRLVRITRKGETHDEREDLGGVRFVPLIGSEGWHDRRSAGRHPVDPPPPSRPMRLRPHSIVGRVRDAATPFDSVERVDLAPLLDRIGDRRLVLLGESTHGSSEFTRLRSRITEALVRHRGFTIVAIESDWPDAARIDRYVRGHDAPDAEAASIDRFPSCRCHNEEMRSFVERLHEINESRGPAGRARVAGLDLYGLHASIADVVGTLDALDPDAAAVARHRYGRLTPWEQDPSTYDRAALDRSFILREEPIVARLRQRLGHRLERERIGHDRFFDAVSNAHWIVEADRYYRTLYRGNAAAWNLRSQHMFDTLDRLLAHHGPGSKMVVWAHNTHVGNAAATEMAARGEPNLGQLCRARFGDAVYSIGLSTDHGTVAAANSWGGPVGRVRIRPALAESIEALLHDTEHEMCFLPLRHPRDPGLRHTLSAPRLERAIGEVYRPETERASHYFHAVLPRQFDEWIWIDRTRAVRPIEPHLLAGAPETYPFGIGATARLDPHGTERSRR